MNDMAFDKGITDVGRHDAKSAGLIYATDDRSGITRQQKGTGFSYFDRNGKTIRDPNVLERIKKLVIPPMWKQVWICPTTNGHIQATGRDAKGRKQYIYHLHFRAIREANKFDRVVAFAGLLPKLREQVDRDMRRRGLPREKVLATVVFLLDQALIRVGNASYAKENGSFGLSTLRDNHVEATSQEVRFDFLGKSGKKWCVSVRNRRVARIVTACKKLPGRQLFQYLDGNGRRRPVTSTDVNCYLRQVTGQDFTAKDFRPWGATVLAALALHRCEKFKSEAAAKTNIKKTIEITARKLGNTPAVCRKSYVHPSLLQGYLNGAFKIKVKPAEPGRENSPRHIQAAERSILALLRNPAKMLQSNG